MKKTLQHLLLTFTLTTPFASAQLGDVWVSDQLALPLRDQPNLRATIITTLPAGQRLRALEKTADYIKVQTVDGKTGWLPNYYVLNQRSVHEQVGVTKQLLAQSQSAVKQLNQTIAVQKEKIDELNKTLENKTESAPQYETDESFNIRRLSEEKRLLQHKLAEQSETTLQLAEALAIAREKASTARTQYLSLVHVSENAVSIDNKNKQLQQSVVQFEQTTLQLNNKNQRLKEQLATRKDFATAIMIFGGVLIGYLLSILTPRRLTHTPKYKSRYKD